MSIFGLEGNKFPDFTLLINGNQLWILWNSDDDDITLIILKLKGNQLEKSIIIAQHKKNIR